MARTVVGFFDTREQAERAVEELVSSGFMRDNISVATGDLQNEVETPNIGPLHGAGGDTEAGRDAAIGGMAGLVAGAVVASLPGIGPLLAVGPLAAAIGGLGIGAAAGGLIGWLVDRGVTEEEAQYYEEGLRRGGVVVSIDAPEEAAGNASDILKHAGAVDVLKRAAEWRREGWRPGPRVRRAG